MIPLYLVTAALFLVLDAVVLSVVMKPLFARHLGAALRDSPMLAPAAGFYLAYVAGLVYLVSLPALRAGAPGQALVQGLVVGAMAYGTYEFTSMSVMRDWSWQMVAADTLWGTLLTGFCAWAGVALMLRFG
jgi:uncharacterized membrane protein